eukprot:TRINITY_DN3819_c0_g1_i5.p1 TRINITY_DN3819_c0_g1~~TRINITY_DN3819_c0_g1_i5.p1  ORF type:complete len:418 (-),score=103.33 TRINITY_DN3819_c0_g1_i5:622-1875(-)
MQTSPLDFFQDWIMIDETFNDQMKLRNKLLKENFQDTVARGSGKRSTEDAKLETLEVLMDHLPKRFPYLFRRSGKGKKVSFTDFQRRVGLQILSTGEMVEPSPDEDPLVTCARLTCEDYCIMEFDPTCSEYVLTSGVVCFPMRWNLAEKMNQPMNSIHQPVVAFVKHLKHLVADVFVSLPPGKGVKRGNWSIFNDLESVLDLFSPKPFSLRSEENQVVQYGHHLGRKLKQWYQRRVRGGTNSSADAMDVHHEPIRRPFLFTKEIPGRVRMQTSPLDFFQDWIMIDETFNDQMKLRNKLLKENFQDTVARGSGKRSTEDAKLETLEVLMDHLPKRFPYLFRRSGKGLQILSTGEMVEPSPDEDPLVTCARLTCEDYCIMEFDPTCSEYVLTSGVVCFPMRWNLAVCTFSTLFMGSRRN